MFRCGSLVMVRGGGSVGVVRVALALFGCADSFGWADRFGYVVVVCCLRLHAFGFYRMSWRICDG
jgi:hypothetical protein